MKDIAIIKNLVGQRATEEDMKFIDCKGTAFHGTAFRGKNYSRTAGGVKLCVGFLTHAQI